MLFLPGLTLRCFRLMKYANETKKMKLKNCPASSKGFSLVEVIVSVLITGAIVLVVANIPQAVKLITTGKSESKVREVAAKKIEDTRLSGYDNLANGTTTLQDSRLNQLTNVLASTIIADCPQEICPNGELVKKVTVKISWSEQGEPKTFQTVTLIAKDGLR